jgi:hypothetical protein
MINGLDSLVITKLDVLDGLDEIQICNAYRCGSEVLTDFPSDVRQLAACEPIFESHPGSAGTWVTSTFLPLVQITAQALLPGAAEGRALRRLFHPPQHGARANLVSIVSSPPSGRVKGGSDRPEFRARTLKIVPVATN